MKRSTFISGTLFLSGAALLSKIVGATFRIPLQNIAGDEVLGIFSLVYPVYMVALILSVAGIPLAISKLIAEARGRGKNRIVKEIHQTAGILAVFFGLLSFLIIYVLANPLAAALGGKEVRPALLIVSATLLIAPFMATYRGFFQGYENMKPTAVSQVIEQVVRVSFMLGIAYYLVYHQATASVIAGGVMAGSVAGVLASLFYLWRKYRKTVRLPSVPYSIDTFRRQGRKILTLSIPIAFGSITLALMSVMDAFTIPFALRNTGADETITYAYGIYGRGLSIVQIATVFATSLVLPLIPLMTKKAEEGDSSKVRHIIRKAFTITHLVSWPAAAGLLALTLPINIALFTNLEGSLLIALFSLSSVFISLSILGTGILQGMDRAKKAAILVIAAVAAKGAANVYLVYSYGLLGAALSTLLIYLLLYLANHYFITKEVQGISVSRDVWKSILSALLMGGVIGLPLLDNNLHVWSRADASFYVTGSILIGGTLYILMLLGMGVKEMDAFKRQVQCKLKRK